MPFFAKCAEGLEDILAYELKLYGISTLQVGSSKVIFDCENDRINELMMKLRTADNIFFIRDFGTTSDSNLKGIRLNKKPLYLRRYRLFNHPSSLLPSVAAALLLCTDMKRDLIDPFVGGGTIVVEDALIMHGSEEASLPYPAGKHRVMGVDINRHHLSGARKNARKAGVANLIDLKLNDSTRIKLYPPFARMVTNPPYGVRGSKRERIKKLYDRFVANIDNILASNAEGVMITTEWNLLLNLLRERGFKLKEVRKIKHRKLYTAAIHFTL
jgi:23S rRNA G2445 N2-methylase RlmL